MRFLSGINRPVAGLVLRNSLAEGCISAENFGTDSVFCRLEKFVKSLKSFCCRQASLLIIGDKISMNFHSFTKRNIDELNDFGA